MLRTWLARLKSAEKLVPVVASLRTLPNGSSVNVWAQIAPQVTDAIRPRSSCVYVQSLPAPEPEIGWLFQSSRSDPSAFHTRGPRLLPRGQSRRGKSRIIRRRRGDPPPAR